jgi:hemolysin-activating ACP:hemolysin acyltransferase
MTPLIGTEGGSTGFLVENTLETEKYLACCPAMFVYMLSYIFTFVPVSSMLEKILPVKKQKQLLCRISDRRAGVCR